LIDNDGDDQTAGNRIEEEIHAAYKTMAWPTERRKGTLFVPIQTVPSESFFT